MYLINFYVLRLLKSPTYKFLRYNMCIRNSPHYPRPRYLGVSIVLVDGAAIGPCQLATDGPQEVDLSVLCNPSLRLR